MKNRVTVIPDDNTIIVDDTPLIFNFASPTNLHALQWYNGSGHTEWTDDRNHPLTEADYETDVAPFVALWEVEKNRLKAEAEAEANRKPTLAEAKTAKLHDINTATDAALSALTGGYPGSELLTFDKQETEARAYLADPAAPTPLLSALAAGRGIPLDDLAQRVIAKADSFAAISGHVIGQRQRLEDQVGAAETIEAVQAIEIQLNLPGQLEPEQVLPEPESTGIDES